ncbi:MAG: DMT family transporter [Chloroflexi bacterium]|uniref:DMT family transporter n=1 Tax=Candidatus Flexifilum breve TaxID=3140694 RepID=UPI003135D4D4|nr:DMT family transporter [Chloroflexota bacterium]
MLKGAFYGLTAAATWGGLYVVSDIVLETIPPFTLLTIRILIGLLLLGLFARLNSKLIYPDRRGALKLLGVGFLGFGISIGAQFVGTDKSTAFNGALITSAAPAFILLFAALILREKLTVQRIAAVILATIGVIIIIDPANVNFSSDTFFGDISLAFAALTWGLYSVLVRRVSGQFDTLIVSLYALLGGLVFTLPAAAQELTVRPVGTIDLPILLGVLYLSVIAMALAMWMWNRAFALVEASIASLFFFAQPLVGGLLSVLVRGQELTPSLQLGSALIIGGVLLTIVTPRPSPERAKLDIVEPS